MGKRMGRYTVVMERKPAILGYAAICGKKESGLWAPPLT